MRLRAGQRRAVIVFIVCACLTSVAVLIRKVQRILYLESLEKLVEHRARVLTTVYLGRGNSGRNVPIVYFLIYSETPDFPLDVVCNSVNGTRSVTEDLKLVSTSSSGVHVFGFCETLERLGGIDLEIDDFRVPFEPYRPVAREDEVVCLAISFLDSDWARLKRIIDHYLQDSEKAKILLYVSSMEREGFSALRDEDVYSERVQIVPWEIYRKKSNFLHVKPALYAQTVVGALTDCWLRYAPVTTKIVLVDLASVVFPGHRTLPAVTGDASLFRKMHMVWSVENVHLQTVSIDDGSLSLKETCFCKRCARDTKCTAMAKAQEGPTTTIRLKSSQRTIGGPLGFYAQQLADCVQQSLEAESAQPVNKQVPVETAVKLEFRVGEAVHQKKEQEQERSDTDDACLLKLKADKRPCAVAVDAHTRRLFRDRLRVDVSQRRDFVTHNDGCHFP